MRIGEGEGVAASRLGQNVARVIQRDIANVGFIVAASTIEIHFPCVGSAAPVKGIVTFTGVDHAAGDAAADINGVITLTRLNCHFRVVDGLQGSRVFDGFIAIATGINHR